MERHTLPWRLELEKGVDTGCTDGAFVIFNADNDIVIAGGTYTCDGDDEINLNQDDAGWLVTAVNTLYYHDMLGGEE